MAAEHEPVVSGLADPTRDIRLPPLPGTQPPALPPEWQDVRPPAPEPEGTGPEDPAPEDPAPDAVLAEQPTDQLGSPPPAERDRTLTFDGSAAEHWAAGHAAPPDRAWSSVPPASRPIVGPRSRPAAGRRSRRWPWVVLTLLPVLVIVVTGVWLLLLMRAG